MPDPEQPDQQFTQGDDFAPASSAPTDDADGGVAGGLEQPPEEESGDLQRELLMGDVHSDQVGLFDTHSLPSAAPAEAVVSEVTTPTAPEQAATTVTSTLSPMVGATAQAAQQAAQAVVSTAKGATQQVTAAVQQQAQKITVAPRKAVYRGKRFLLAYGGLVAAFGLIAALAKRYRYFPADVGISRAIQSPHSKAYDMLMHAASELGWRWISVGTRASISTLMWAAGFRMESAFTISTWSGDLLTGIIKAGVVRPRPTRDLVRVVSDLEEASFPSGHVVHYVTFYGFLFYLVFIHLKQRWFRTALLTLLAGVILMVGPSRIYMGHHWPSDVGGAYFVGTLWLGVIIIAYLETKANYTLHTRPPFFVKRPQQIG